MIVLDLAVLESIKPYEPLSIKASNISHSKLVNKVLNWAVVHTDYGFSVQERGGQLYVRITNKKKESRKIKYSWY